MPSWLILSWSLTFAYFPSFLPNSTSVANLQADSKGYYSTNIDLSFDVLNHLRVYTDWQAFALSKGDGFFLPYRIDYIFGIGLHTRNFELGILHECDHPVLFQRSQSFRPFDLSQETSIYLRIKGKE
jgi:hypothetical protein